MATSSAPSDHHPHPHEQSADDVQDDIHLSESATMADDDQARSTSLNGELENRQDKGQAETAALNPSTDLMDGNDTSTSFATFSAPASGISGSTSTMQTDHGDGGDNTTTNGNPSSSSLPEAASHISLSALQRFSRHQTSQLKRSRLAHLKLQHMNHMLRTKVREQDNFIQKLESELEDAENKLFAALHPRSVLCRAEKNRLAQQSVFDPEEWEDWQVKAAREFFLECHHGGHGLNFDHDFDYPARDDGYDTDAADDGYNDDDTDDHDNDQDVAGPTNRQDKGKARAISLSSRLSSHDSDFSETDSIVAWMANKASINRTMELTLQYCKERGIELPPHLRYEERDPTDRGEDADSESEESLMSFSCASSHLSTTRPLLPPQGRLISIKDEDINTANSQDSSEVSITIGEKESEHITDLQMVFGAGTGEDRFIDHEFDIPNLEALLRKEAEEWTLNDVDHANRLLYPNNVTTKAAEINDEDHFKIETPFATPPHLATARFEDQFTADGELISTTQSRSASASGDTPEGTPVDIQGHTNAVGNTNESVNGNATPDSSSNGQKVRLITSTMTTHNMLFYGPAPRILKTGLDTTIGAVQGGNYQAQPLDADDTRGTGNSFLNNSSYSYQYQRNGFTRPGFYNDASQQQRLGFGNFSNGRNGFGFGVGGFNNRQRERNGYEAEIVLTPLYFKYGICYNPVARLRFESTPNAGTTETHGLFATVNDHNSISTTTTMNANMSAGASSNLGKGDIGAGSFRTVIISNLPSTIALRTLLPTPLNSCTSQHQQTLLIRGGTVVRAIITDTTRLTGCKSALVVFRSQKAAENCVEWVNEGRLRGYLESGGHEVDVEHGDEKGVEATLLKSATYPYRKLLAESCLPPRPVAAKDTPGKHQKPTRMLTIRDFPHARIPRIEVLCDLTGTAGLNIGPVGSGADFEDENAILESYQGIGILRVWVEGDDAESKASSVIAGLETAEKDESGEESGPANDEVDDGEKDGLGVGNEIVNGAGEVSQTKDSEGPSKFLDSDSSNEHIHTPESERDRDSNDTVSNNDNNNNATDASEDANGDASPATTAGHFSTLHMEFSSIAAAVRGLSMLKRRRAYEYLAFEFDSDPCAEGFSSDDDDDESVGDESADEVEAGKEKSDVKANGKEVPGTTGVPSNFGSGYGHDTSYSSTTAPTPTNHYHPTLAHHWGRTNNNINNLLHPNVNPDEINIDVDSELDLDTDNSNTFTVPSFSSSFDASHETHDQEIRVQDVIASTATVANAVAATLENRNKGANLNFNLDSTLSWADEVIEAAADADAPIYP